MGKKHHFFDEKYKEKVKCICIQHIGNDSTEERQVQKAGTPGLY